MHIAIIITSVLLSFAKITIVFVIRIHSEYKTFSCHQLEVIDLFQCQPKGLNCQIAVILRKINRRAVTIIANALMVNALMECVNVIPFLIITLLQTRSARQKRKFYPYR